MKILVTGAAGFIGSRVCEFLVDQGNQVLGIDNLNNAYDVRMKLHRLEHLKEKENFTFVKIDITDKEDCHSLMAGFKPGYQITPDFRLDAIINLAARAGVRQSVENPWGYVDTNITGTLNLLEICNSLRIPKFILASTSSVYGSNAPLPTPETASSDYPIQPYAASKKGAEVLCHAYHCLYGIDVSIFRYFTVYGPAGRPDMSMFRFVKWIYEGSPVLLNGDGEQSRGFTYVDDIARGTILGLQPMGFEIINLGGHEQIKMNTLIEMIEQRVGKTADVVHKPANPADMLANWADISKAKRLLGWQPQVSLSTGVTHLVNWYNAERVWAKEINTSE